MLAAINELHGLELHLGGGGPLGWSTFDNWLSRSNYAECTQTTAALIGPSGRVRAARSSGSGPLVQHGALCDRIRAMLGTPATATPAASLALRAPHLTTWPKPSAPPMPTPLATLERGARVAPLPARAPPPMPCKRLAPADLSAPPAAKTAAPSGARVGKEEAPQKSEKKPKKAKKGCSWRTSVLL